MASCAAGLGAGGPAGSSACMPGITGRHFASAAAGVHASIMAAALPTLGGAMGASPKLCWTSLAMQLLRFWTDEVRDLFARHACSPLNLQIRRLSRFAECSACNFASPWRPQSASHQTHLD